jgi:methyltransferase family protein
LIESAAMANAAAYFNGLNEKLLAAIPQDARSVLELGCANGHLGAACKRRSALRWTGVDQSAAALAAAATRLDAVVSMDLDSPDAARLGGNYDLVVCGDVLEHLRDPAACLRVAHTVSAPGARLVCCVPNMAHATVIARLLAGDLSYDEAGLLDATHVRFLSRASTFKLLLDCGWLPNVCDRYVVGHSSQAFLQGLIGAARQLGIPEQTALTNLVSYQLIIDCIKSPPPPAQAEGASFSVVVPVTNRQQLELNVLRSPGLAEVRAAIIPVEGARDPAQALASARTRVVTPWIVFCHQDVYFPSGSGRALAALLGSLPRAAARTALVGFAGVGEHEPGVLGPAGLVIDRSARFDHPASAAAVSIDEFAIALGADTIHAIDPACGWHLWATDLCLAALAGRGGEARIARVPLFHNSYNDGRLPAAFHETARLLRAKYPQFPAIATLCGVIGSPAEPSPAARALS